MPRTVLFFESHSGYFYGSQQSLCLLVEHLDRSRFRPVFAGPTEGPLTQRLAAAGVRTVIVPPPERLREYGGSVVHGNLWTKACRLLSYLAYSRRIVRLMRAEAVEVGHCNSIRSLLTLGLAARLARIPLIWHLRLNLDLGWWNRLALKLADRIIVVSDYLRQEFPSDISDSRKFVTVHNGVDVTAFQSKGARFGESLALEAGWQTVGSVGTLTPRKGQLDLLRAFTQVLCRRPSTKLVMVGGTDGPDGDAYAERLRKYVSAEKLDEHVTFTGWRSDVASILCQLDLLVLPSFNEGLPRAVLEAMALGLPVVATNVGGTSELVVDGQTGLLVPAGDPDALATAIAAILDDPERARSMGRLGRERVEKNFSLESSVRGVEAVIDTLLTGRGPVKVPMAPTPAGRA